MLQIKEKLYQYCMDHVDQRMLTAQKAIEDAQEASASETKSSAGDKYETGRAMAQQEIDRNRGQLSEAGKLKQALERINPNKIHHMVQPGSLVITDHGSFYLAISAGQIHLQEAEYFAVSPASPIGMKLAGKGKGDEVEFNVKKYKILEVF